MKHRLPKGLLAALVLTSAASAAPLARELREASVRYVNSLQNVDGGFRASASEGSSDIANVLVAVRAIHHFGGKVEHQRRVVLYVNSLYDTVSGAFHGPRRSQDVRTTAMGLMTLVELKQPVDELGPTVVQFFDQYAKGIPDIYIAEAALAAAGLRPLHPRAWLDAMGATHNSDGSFGKTVADTARAVITYLRLNARVPNRSGAVKTMQAAQKADGGFGGPAAGSDLATTYPVMRAFSMLREKPDLDHVRAFVDRCRNDDGGYGVSPGQPSSVDATYYAAIILHWIDEMER